MISKAELEDQDWYDGFVWVNGSQKGVRTLKWSANLNLFYNPIMDPEVHFEHHEDKVQTLSTTFEPNTSSLNPHLKTRGTL